MKPKSKKKPTPPPAKKPNTVICTGSEIALVLGKARRMGCTTGEPTKIGIDKYEIGIGSPADTFDRKPSEAEEIWTFGHPNNV
jgi:hypothetical protein